MQPAFTQSMSLLHIITMNSYMSSFFHFFSKFLFPPVSVSQYLLALAVLAQLEASFTKAAAAAIAAAGGVEMVVVVIGQLAIN